MTLPHAPTRRPTRTRAAVAALLLASAPAWALENCEVNGQPVNPANGSTTADKTGLMRCKDRDTGVVQREQELRGGRFMGIERRYTDGRLSRERSVNANGNSDGRAREFAPDGTVLADAVYDNGELVGISRRFHPNGQLKRAAFYGKGNDERAVAEFTPRGQLHDLRCGVQPLLAPAVDDARLCGFSGGPSRLEFFRDDGQMTGRAVYDAGRRLKLEQLWDNGAVSQSQETSGNTRVDRSFSREGQKKRDTVWTLSGTMAVMERDQEFAASGSLLRERTWTRGDLVSDEQFYLNGQPRQRNVYTTDGNLRSLESTFFHDNGQPASTGRYLAPGRSSQIPQGAHKRFDASGKLRAQTDYDAQGKPTREREWDEAGQPTRDDAVFEDGSRKAFSK